MKYLFFFFYIFCTTDNIVLDLVNKCREAIDKINNLGPSRMNEMSMTDVTER